MREGLGEGEIESEVRLIVWYTISIRGGWKGNNIQRYCYSIIIRTSLRGWLNR